MSNSPEVLEERIRELLDRLVRCDSVDKDTREVVYDDVAAEARELSRADILQMLDKAIGSSKKRREKAVYVLSAWIDLPEVVERIGDWMHDPDPNWRHWLIQVVGSNKLPGFDWHLNHLIQHDPDDNCRDMAIHAAGQLTSAECLPTILKLVKEDVPQMRFCLVETLCQYGTRECEPYLSKWYGDNSQRKSIRIFAVWGLAKLGNQEAIEFLIEMLDDPDERGEKHFSPGQSTRAAQALCDIYGWPFEWNRSFVTSTKARISRSRGNE